MDSLDQLVKHLPQEDDRILHKQEHPRLIKKITQTIIVEHSKRLDHCFACSEPFTHTDDIVYQVMRDDTIDYKIDEMYLNEMKYFRRQATESPICNNIFLRAYHRSKENCYNGIPIRCYESTKKRVLIHPSIIQRETNEGRLSIEDFITNHHKSKVVLAFVYSDIESFTILSNSIDSYDIKLNKKYHPNPPKLYHIETQKEQEQENERQNTHTSFIINMPRIVSEVLDIRLEAWTEVNMYGMFQNISIIDIIMDNKITVPAQLRQLRLCLSKHFKEHSSLLTGCVYAFRKSDSNSNNKHTTTWRMIVRIELNVHSFRERIYDFFMRSFLHIDTDYPGIMTWEQVNNDNILEYTNQTRYVASKQTNFIPGEATLSIKRRIQEWITRRKENQSIIKKCLNNIHLDLNTLSNNVKEEDSQWINQTEHDEHDFIYRMNTQKISTMTKTDQTQVYYTQSLHIPSIENIQCWEYDSSLTTSSYAYCPHLYHDQDIDTHKRDMECIGFKKVQLDTISVLYPLEL